MDIGHAANYFNILPLQGWDYTLTGDPWVTSNLPSARLLVADREQTYGSAVRWRTLLTQAAIPARYKAVRIGQAVYILGQPDQDVDIVSYSLSYPVYRADKWVSVFLVNANSTVGLGGLANKAGRTRVNPGQALPCGIDRIGSSQAFDSVLTDMVLVVPDDLVTVSARHELDDDAHTYQVKEAYNANGFQVIRAIRKSRVIP